MRKARKNFITQMQKRIRAKNVIWTTWRKYKFLRIAKLLAYQKKNQASFIIQKYLYGYLAR